MKKKEKLFFSGCPNRKHPLLKKDTGEAIEEGRIDARKAGESLARITDALFLEKLKALDGKFTCDRKDIIDDDFYQLLEKNMPDLRGKMAPSGGELLKYPPSEGYIVVEANTTEGLQAMVNMLCKTHNFRPSGGICFARGEFYQTLVKNEGHFSVELEQKASDVPPSGKKRKKK